MGVGTTFLVLFPLNGSVIAGGAQRTYVVIKSKDDSAKDAAIRVAMIKWLS